MTGRVIGRQPMIGVTFLTPDQRWLEIEFVVDTGFDGFLTLPIEAVTALNLPFLQIIGANLADGANCYVSLYMATIVWGSDQREVPVLALGKRPLLGTSLLDSQELVIQFVDGGRVNIEKMESDSPQV